MRLKRILSIAAALIVCESSIAHPAAASGIKVIANTSVAATSISSDDLREIFLENKNSLEDGSHVEPVLEKKAGPVHEEFLRLYVGKHDYALQTYYRSLMFTGKASMPKAFASDAEAIAYVARTKGAIGYVSSNTSIAGVKVLTVR